MSSELIPCYVAFCDEHSPVTNRKNVYLGIHRFIDYTIRSTKCLTKSIEIVWDNMKTFRWNRRPHVGEVAKRSRSLAQFTFPSQSVINRKRVCNVNDNVVKKRRCMRRPENFHACYPLTAFFASSFSWIRLKTSSLGIPPPSAISLREISISRESSIWSKSSSMDFASTRYDAALPFCVIRTGRCVSRTRPMYIERLLRHSENGTTSSEGRQRRSGISRTLCISFTLSLLKNMLCIVQNFGIPVKGE